MEDLLQNRIWVLEAVLEEKDILTRRLAAENDALRHRISKMEEQLSLLLTSNTLPEHAH